MRTLTVLSRSYCHLCKDLIAALEEFRGRFSFPFEVTVVDVDRHPHLEQRWGDKVPVLLEGDAEICHYFFNADALTKHLSQPAGGTTGA